MRPLFKALSIVILTICALPAPARAGTFEIQSWNGSGSASAAYDMDPGSDVRGVNVDGSMCPLIPAPGANTATANLAGLQKSLWENEPSRIGGTLSAATGFSFYNSGHVANRTFDFQFTWKPDQFYDPTTGNFSDRVDDVCPETIKVVLVYDLMAQCYAKSTHPSYSASSYARVEIDGCELEVPTVTVPNLFYNEQNIPKGSRHYKVHEVALENGQGTLSVSSSSDVLASTMWFSEAIANTRVEIEARIADFHVMSPEMDPSFYHVFDNESHFGMQHQRLFGQPTVVDSVLYHSNAASVPHEELPVWAQGANTYLPAAFPFTVKGLASPFEQSWYNWYISGSPHTGLAGDHLYPHGSEVQVPLAFELDPVADRLRANKSTTITANVQPGNGAGPLPDSPILQNTLSITWHLPYENWQGYRPSTSYWETVEIEQTSSDAINNGTVSASWDIHKVLLAEVTNDIAGVTGVIANMVDNSFLSGLLAAVGLLIADTAPEPDSGSASFNDCWNQPGSTIEGGEWNDSMKSHYRMKPELRFGYTRHWLEAETYNSHGYAGQTRKALSVRDGRAEWVGHFERADSDPEFP